MGRYNNPMLKGKPIESFEANTCETKQFWGKRGTGKKLPPDTIPNRFPDLSCEDHPDLNISGIIIKACNEGATRLGDPGTGFISQNYLNACPPGYHLPTLAEWRSLFAVAGGRIGFQNAYIHWDKISLGKKYFAKIIYGIPAMSGAYLNGTSATSGFYLNDKPEMSGLYLHHPGIYRSSEATGSIEIIGTEIKNPWFHSKSIDFRTGMVRCFKDCQGVCNKKVIPAYQDKCA